MAVTARLVINTVATLTAFLPALAALRARRSLDEPAGQAALGWFAIGLTGVVNFAAYRLTSPGFDRTVIAAVGTVLYVPFLLPHTLAWMGRGATRWRWPAIGAWMVCAGILLATLGAGRTFRTLVLPIVALLICAVTGMAIASCVRRAPIALRRHDWFWILNGQLLYFTVEIFRKPVIEALVARHWDAMVAVHYGMVMMYSVCHLIIARGMLLRAPATAPPAPLRPSFAPST